MTLAGCLNKGTHFFYFSHSRRKELFLKYHLKMKRSSLFKSLARPDFVKFDFLLCLVAFESEVILELVFKNAFLSVHLWYATHGIKLTGKSACQNSKSMNSNFNHLYNSKRMYFQNNQKSPKLSLPYQSEQNTLFNKCCRKLL